MNIEHVSKETSVCDLADLLERDGCVVIDRLLDEQMVDDILGEMSPYMEDAEYGDDVFDGFATRRIGSLVERSPTSHQVIMDPMVLGVADKALSHASNYQLHCTQVISVGPDSKPQPIHRDQWAFDMFPFPPGYDSTFSTMWALTDFTETNGATRVIPGSHKHEDKLQYEIAQSVPAEMSKGSVLLYTGSLYHGAGANLTDQERIGLIIHYSLGWLRQEENQYLSTSDDVVKTLPEDLLRLMGYQQGAYSLGFIDGGVDSITAVRPELARSGPDYTLNV